MRGYGDSLAEHGPSGCRGEGFSKRSDELTRGSLHFVRSGTAELHLGQKHNDAGAGRQMVHLSSRRDTRCTPLPGPASCPVCAASPHALGGRATEQGSPLPPPWCADAMCMGWACAARARQEAAGYSFSRTSLSRSPDSIMRILFACHLEMLTRAQTACSCIRKLSELSSRINGMTICGGVRRRMRRGGE
jgi:hypothetical protein